MPRYQFQAPHNLSREQVKERVKHFSEKYSASLEWKKENEGHFSGQHKGVSVSGVFTIFDEEVDVSLNLPLMVMPFKSKIKEEVIKELG